MTKHRKSPSRVRAGRKAWRRLVKKYGSKKAALRHTIHK
jgi:hypothetical protein